MNALHQGVHGKHQILPRRYPLDSAVVAGTKKELILPDTIGQRLEIRPDQLKLTHESTRTGLGQAKPAAEFVQNAVHKLVPFGATKALGHFTALVDYHLLSNLNTMRQLIGSQADDSQFYRVDLLEGANQTRLKQIAELPLLAVNATQKIPKIHD